MEMYLSMQTRKNSTYEMVEEWSSSFLWLLQPGKVYKTWNAPNKDI